MIPAASHFKMRCPWTASYAAISIICLKPESWTSRSRAGSLLSPSAWTYLKAPSAHLSWAFKIIAEPSSLSLSCCLRSPSLQGRAAFLPGIPANQSHRHWGRGVVVGLNRLRLEVAAHKVIFLKEPFQTPLIRKHGA